MMRWVWGGRARLASLHIAVLIFPSIVSSFAVFEPSSSKVLPVDSYRPLEPLQLDLPSPTQTPQHGLDAQKEGPSTLSSLLGAIEVMQDEYFEVFTGTWPKAIDWTAAVFGTHLSATLSTLVSSIDPSSTTCDDLLGWENILDRYFAHTSIFYFGENAFALRQQAFDDMLWVVLGWLENIKFMNLRSDVPFRNGRVDINTSSWHGLQFSGSAAHRARIFYELASTGWDTSLCDGGMVWNPHLVPYKNAITNELFVSASISMYLFFPGDNSESPYMTTNDRSTGFHKPHDRGHLRAAIQAYEWLEKSRMKNDNGLFADGYHIWGWRKLPDGTIHPGTGNCDVLNHMVYTYNQGVILTGERGLWLATGNQSYLDNGHRLIQNVIEATGWLADNGVWRGLGRDGVMEEYCDESGLCSQDGQTFKGIFFHHLTEFCRPLRPEEKEFLDENGRKDLDEVTFQQHQLHCAQYRPWIAYNAKAALMTRDHKGRFGMWWGRKYQDLESHNPFARPLLTPGAVDYRNKPIPKDAQDDWCSGEPTSEQRYCERLSDVASNHSKRKTVFLDLNDRGRARTAETQSGGIAVLRALVQWETSAK